MSKGLRERRELATCILGEGHTGALYTERPVQRPCGENVPGTCQKQHGGHVVTAEVRRDRGKR